MIGFEATKAVDAVIETCAKAFEGNAAAAQGAFKRATVFGPILAQVKIDKDAQLHAAHGNIGAYWDCSKSIPGGFVSVYVFGAEEAQRGKMVTALVDFKNKEHRPGDIVHYLRAQVVPSIVSSDVKLQLTRQEDSGALILNLPVEMIEEGKEKRRKYAVGFQYIDKSRVNDPAVDQMVDTMMNNHQAEACAG
ncbi:MAG: hypothetical protein AUJ11_00730 [Parcubacteria group bacterium CG1_02_44_65]|nr:MAG: hypothetical protein AUJ11_00730 [Parcubacteria group bacterium CG1_02_44_65]